MGAVGIAVALVGGATAPAAARSDDVRGRYTAVAVSGPDCTSPVGLCTQGTLSGALKGDYTWRVSALTATADSPTTGVVTYTADMTVTTRDGSFTCKDAGALGTGSEDASASVCVLVAGTGSYAGATGVLQLVGRTDTQSQSGRFSGTISQAG